MSKSRSYDMQDWDTLKARYPKALEKLFLHPAAVATEAEMQINTFDCPNGVRIVVTRERDDDEIHLHVSACIHPDHVAPHINGLLRMMRNESRQRVLKKMVMEAFLNVSGRELPQCPVHVSDTGIPHWKIPLTDVNPVVE